MTDKEDQVSGELQWHLVENGHLRAGSGHGFDYDIIFTGDGRVSWQGLDYGEWKYVDSVEAAKTAAQAEADGLNMVPSP